MMKYEDICTRKAFEVNGEQKVVWLKCGTLRTNDKGNRFIEMNHAPDTTFYVFEQKSREGKPKDTTASDKNVLPEPAIDWANEK